MSVCVVPCGKPGPMSRQDGETVNCMVTHHHSQHDYLSFDGAWLHCSGVMRNLTILERDWTQQESHTAGDHRNCGPACQYSGQDLRECPIFTQLSWENEVRMSSILVRETYWHYPVHRLKDMAREHSIKGYSRMTKGQLIHAIMESTAVTPSPTEGGV